MASCAAGVAGNSWRPAVRHQSAKRSWPLTQVQRVLGACGLAAAWRIRSAWASQAVEFRHPGEPDHQCSWPHSQPTEYPWERTSASGHRDPQGSSPGEIRIETNVRVPPAMQSTSDVQLLASDVRVEGLRHQVGDHADPRREPVSQNV